MRSPRPVSDRDAGAVPAPGLNKIFEVVIRGGRIVTPEGIQDADVGVVDGRIARIAPAIEDDAALVIEAEGRYLFPGIIDARVHFNEPGRAEWEGFATGSAALVAGGGTSYFDLPHHSEPPVLDAAALREKRRLAEETSCLDFALWGGLGPQNLDKLAALRDAGAIGLHAFMGPDGTVSLPTVDATVLREGMKRAAKLGMIVAVHAEDATLVAQYSAIQNGKSRKTAAAWLASRPVETELAAIRLALELAGETGCALHVAHVSSPEGLGLIDEARMQRVDVTAETSPHYLLLNARDVARIGVTAKCSPPIREEASRAELWRDLRADRIQNIASNHSPAPPEQRPKGDFHSAWSGVAGCQHGFALLLSACEATAAQDLPRLAALLARNVARRFRLDIHKGVIAEGKDADFSLIEFGPAHAIKADELWTRHRSSVYVGRRSKARVTHTFLRGAAVFADGRLVNLSAPGRFLRPQH
jgi:allantoinase